VYKSVLGYLDTLLSEEEGTMYRLKHYLVENLVGSSILVSTSDVVVPPLPPVVLLGHHGSSRVASVSVVTDSVGATSPCEPSTSSIVDWYRGSSGHFAVTTGSTTGFVVGEADGEGRDELGGDGGNDEPQGVVVHDVGRSEVAESVVGRDEQSEVNAEGNDSDEEGEEGEDGGNESQSKVGSKSEEQGDETQSSGDGVKDERVGEAMNDNSSSLGSSRGILLNEGRVVSKLAL